jgi:hypothetical protein
MKKKNLKAMKKTVLILKVFVIVIAINSIANAQLAKQSFLRGTEIIVPFSYI